jgi:cyclic-di-GMP-binding protein
MMMMMASGEASFDVVSEFDAQELTNALDQVKREIGARFDLKDANTEMDLGKEALTITTADETKLKNVILIIEERLIKRGLSPFLLDTQSTSPEAALGARVRQEFPLKTGIDSDLARKVVAEIKSLKLKVQSAIQGEQVRVTGKSRDELQAVMAHLRQCASKWEVPLQFNNFR